jgi:hypothetical protein
MARGSADPWRELCGAWTSDLRIAMPGAPSSQSGLGLASRKLWLCLSLPNSDALQHALEATSVLAERPRAQALRRHRGIPTA